VWITQWHQLCDWMQHFGLMWPYFSRWFNINFCHQVLWNFCLQKQSESVIPPVLRDSCSVDILDREALGISNIVRKLIVFFPPPLLVGMRADMLQSFLEQLTQLTCRFSEGAAQEESVGVLNHLDLCQIYCINICIVTGNISALIKCRWSCTGI
jgi:hypothetical protein